MEIKKDCFAYDEIVGCNALAEMKCHKCAFYKPQSEVDMVAYKEFIESLSNLADRPRRWRARRDLQKG